MRMVLILVFITELFSLPSWYHQIPNTKQNILIGYGEGIDEAEAKKEALNDIASQISIEIDSTLDSAKGVSAGRLYRDIKTRSRQKSHAKIQGYEVLKFSFESGKYFTALQYENIPSIDKFNRALRELNSSKQHNRYLKESAIGREVKGGVDFTLRRKDKLWYIGNEDISIALDSNDFAKFFSSYSAPEIHFEVSKSVLYEGDFFHFDVQVQKAGYVTILTVYEDGTVSTLLRNIKLNANTKEQIPDKDFESELQAGLMQKGRQTYDLYVALWHEKRRHFDSFATADEKLITDERYKNFDTLIKMLDTEIFSTLKVVTKPR